MFNRGLEVVKITSDNILAGIQEKKNEMKAYAEGNSLKEDGLKEKINDRVKEVFNLSDDASLNAFNTMLVNKFLENDFDLSDTQILNDLLELVKFSLFIKLENSSDTRNSQEKAFESINEIFTFLSEREKVDFNKLIN